MYYTDLSPTAQTAYAELFEAVTARHLNRSVAHLTGSFAKKTVKGRLYWYFQFRDLDGRVRQIYVGPDGDRIRALLDLSRQAPTASVVPLSRSAMALGCHPLIPVHFRIVRRLSEWGFFNAGGILIGTHAFLAMGNMLGVTWSMGARTQDVDFAHAGKNISIALPATTKVNVHQAIESLEMGFLPITSFEGAPGATYINPSQPDLRVDFVTTRHRGGDEPITPEHLNVAFQPLKFMEFLLESPTQAAVLGQPGGVIATIPSPERYALHKLVVSAERGRRFQAKSNKDLRQAAALIAWFQTNDPDALTEGWQDLLSRGKGWRTRAQKGHRGLRTLDPALAEQLPLPAPG